MYYAGAHISLKRWHSAVVNVSMTLTVPFLIRYILTVLDSNFSCIVRWIVLEERLIYSAPFLTAVCIGDVASRCITVHPWDQVWATSKSP